MKDEQTKLDEAWNIVFKNHVPLEVAKEWIRRGPPLKREPKAPPQDRQMELF